MKKTLSLVTLALVLSMALTGCDAVQTTTATTVAEGATTTTAAADETQTTTANEDKQEITEDAHVLLQTQLDELTAAGKMANMTFTYDTALGASIAEDPSTVTVGMTDEANFGVMGAWYADLDNDGTDELLVASLKRMAAENEDSSDLNVLSVKAYAIVAGTVAEIGGDAVELATLNGCHTEDVRLAVQDNKLVLYSSSSIIDPIVNRLLVFAYENGEIKLQGNLESECGGVVSIWLNNEYVYHDEFDESVEKVNPKNYANETDAWKGEAALLGVDTETWNGATTLASIAVTSDTTGDCKATAKVVCNDSLVK